MVINHDKPKEVQLDQIKAGELFVYNGELYIKSNTKRPLSDINNTPGDVCIRMSDGNYVIFDSNITRVYKACVTGGALNYILLN